MSENIHVMLVDDHASFREPLAFMLGREPDLSVAAQADSLAAAREAIRGDNLEIDVAVVDLDLPDGSGTSFLEELHSLRPRTGILVLSAMSDRMRLAQTIEAGAAGIMHKTSRLEDIIKAVRRLHAGTPLLSQQEVVEALRLVVREREKDFEAKLRISKLTPREREVLQVLAEGSSDKEIAEKLYVGVGTIHSHIANILVKLEVQSRLQALVFAIRYGLVHID